MSYTKKTKKKFLYNSNNPSKTMDIYNNENPLDTIPIKYSTLREIKFTIKNLEKLFKNKNYNHKRITMVALIIRIRLNIINKYKKTKYKNAKDVTKRLNLITKYCNFLTKRTKLKTFKERKSLIFKY